MDSFDDGEETTDTTSSSSFVKGCHVILLLLPLVYELRFNFFPLSSESSFFSFREKSRVSMTSNPNHFLAIPAKKAFDLNLSTPIKNFIKATFGDKEDYSTSVDGFNSLRAEALLRSNYKDDCSKLLR